MLRKGLLGVVLLGLVLALGCGEMREKNDSVEVDASAEASSATLYPFKKTGEFVQMSDLSEAGQALHLRHLAEGFTPFHVEKIGGTNQEDCLYVLYYSFDGGCNACAPTVAAVKFKHESYEYTPQAAALLGEYGYAGIPPAVRVAEIGKGQYGILIEDFGMGQGVVVKNLTLFRDRQGSFEIVLDSLANYDDRGFYLDEEKGVVVNLVLEKGAGQSHGMYDLNCRATSSGKAENLNRVFQGEDSIFSDNPTMIGLLAGQGRLVFDGSRYRLVPKN